MKKALAILFLLIFFVQYSFLSVLYEGVFIGLGMITIFVVALCLRDDFGGSLLWSFCLGLFVDYFSTTPFGTYAIIFILIAGVIELYKTKLTQSKNKKMITFASMLFFLIFTDILSVAILQVSIVWGEVADISFLSDIVISKYFITRLTFSFIGVMMSLFVGKVFDVFGMYSKDIKI